MASTITHTGVGNVSNTSGLGYSFSFATLHREDIQVEVIDPSGNRGSKTVTTDYTIENYSEAGSSNSYIKFVSETTRGFTNSQTTYKVRIFRSTSSIPKTTFVAGSSITALDLNKQTKQALHLSEENRDSLSSLALGDGSASVSINSSNIVDLSIQAIDIKSNAVETEKIKDLAVTTNKINDLDVTTGKIANLNVTTAKLANSTGSSDGVTTSKIADGAVTTAKLANSLNASITAAAFTTGMIMMFTGSTAPSGWAFCDGNNGTPDLRNRFIVGAGDAYSSGATGGADSVTLTESQMPTHNHTFSGSGSHTHTHNAYTGIDDNEQTTVLLKTNEADTGYHTTSGVISNANVTISISGDTGNKGGGNAHENRPPYYALAYIMKT